MTLFSHCSSATLQRPKGRVIADSSAVPKPCLRPLLAASPAAAGAAAGWGRALPEAGCAVADAWGPRAVPALWRGAAAGL